MKKSQELSLNMIVIGALALLVLLIVGVVVVVYGGDIIRAIQGIGASPEEVAIITFESSCSSKCRILVGLSPPVSGVISQNQMGQIKAFCCANYDLNSNGEIESSTVLGPEYCALSYSECKISGRNPGQFCKGSYNKEVQSQVIIGQTSTVEVEFDFTRTVNYQSSSTFETVETCNI